MILLAGQPNGALNFKQCKVGGHTRIFPCITVGQSAIEDANQPVDIHFNSGSHAISDMKIRALGPISHFY